MRPILLTLMLLLLLTGSGEAGELKIIEADSRMMVTCEDTEGKLHHCTIHEPEKFPCHQLAAPTPLSVFGSWLHLHCRTT